jgi:D-alanyl-D-alanine carboxypeptidase (penicillin-binding protein 5/6)
MNRNSNNRQSRAQRKRSLMRRRLIVLTMLFVVLALIVFLGWQVIQTITKAVATGDQPVSQAGTTTTQSTTTTTTHATLAVNAQLATPRILVYDLTHDAALYSQNADEKCYPASLTKLLTAIIATEECEPNEEFTVGSELSLLQPNSSTAGLKKGYRLTRDMIIDALLLPSGNDAAYTIAAHVGRKLSGDPEISDLEAVFTFAEKMNEKAQQLGAVNSHFSSPDGYFSTDHYTTAADMLRIAKAVLQYDNLKQSMVKTSAQYTLLSGQKVQYKNSNAIINPANPYYFEGATGMKTGFTDEAGYCVIASAQRNGIEVIAVIMGGTTSDQRWKDAVEMLKEAFALHETTAGTTAAPAA